LTPQTKQSLALLAAAGLAAGLAGCGGSTQAPDSAAQEPAMEKHGCKTDAEGKHSCGSEMKEEAPAPASSATPPAAPKP
jgi:hypothetical protein